MPCLKKASIFDASLEGFSVKCLGGYELNAMV